MFYNLSGDFRSPLFFLFKTNSKLLFLKQNLYLTVCESSGLGGSSIFVSVRAHLGSSSDLLKSWGGVWRSRAEYVCRVVYYWVQCVIVRVTCGARSLHSAASTCAYKEREHHDK